MLRKKSSNRRRNINASSTINFFLHFRADKVVSLWNLFCALAQFHFFKAFSKGQHCIPFLFHWCNMMYDVMLCEWCDDFMLCKMIFVPKIHTHSHSRIHNLFVVYFSASPLIFRCKFCIPLGMSFELLRLLFRRYSRWLFALRLIFRRNQRLFFAVSSAFPLERLLSRKLTLRSLEWLFVASAQLVI